MLLKCYGQFTFRFPKLFPSVNHSVLKSQWTDIFVLPWLFISFSICDVFSWLYWCEVVWFDLFFCNPAFLIIHAGRYVLKGKSSLSDCQCSEFFWAGWDCQLIALNIHSKTAKTGQKNGKGRKCQEIVNREYQVFY